MDLIVQHHPKREDASPLGVVRQTFVQACGPEPARQDGTCSRAVRGHVGCLDRCAARKVNTLVRCPVPGRPTDHPATISLDSVAEGR